MVGGAAQRLRSLLFLFFFGLLNSLVGGCRAATEPKASPKGANRPRACQGCMHVSFWAVPHLHKRVCPWPDMPLAPWVAPGGRASIGVTHACLTHTHARTHAPPAPVPAPGPWAAPSRRSATNRDRGSGSTCAAGGLPALVRSLFTWGAHVGCAGDLPCFFRQHLPTPAPLTHHTSAQSPFK